MYRKLFFLVTLLSALALSACMNPIEKCVEKKQQAYRKANPNANYGQGATANEKFRLECQGSASQ